MLRHGSPAGQHGVSGVDRGCWRQPLSRVLSAILALAVCTSAVLAWPSTADARGRTGAYRVGGTGSHGKGSHYIGGR